MEVGGCVLFIDWLEIWTRLGNFKICVKVRVGLFSFVDRHIFSIAVDIAYFLCM